ncbi:MAG TPA: hypothetical protein VNP04_08745 [Alphaproteobacteria bacterium]|nr:hypothetical protein [Alphaproteobacteria bacterium]
MASFDWSTRELVDAIDAMVDAALIETPAYLAFGGDPPTRVKTSVMKLESDRRHGTNHVAIRFVGIVEFVFARVPKPLTWQSCYLHDLLLVTSIDADVQ